MFGRQQAGGLAAAYAAIIDLTFTHRATKEDWRENRDIVERIRDSAEADRERGIVKELDRTLERMEFVGQQWRAAAKSWQEPRASRLPCKRSTRGVEPGVRLRCARPACTHPTPHRRRTPRRRTVCDALTRGCARVASYEDRREHMRARRLFLGVVVLGLNGGAGCAVDPPSEDLAKQSQAIAYGVNDKDTPERNASVFLSNAAGNSCSGTLITAKLVLTANHCITGSDLNEDDAFAWKGTPVSGAPISIGIGLTKSAHASQTVVATRGWVRKLGRTSNPDTDIALLELSSRPAIGTGSGTWNVKPVRPWDNDPLLPGKTLRCPSAISGISYSGWGWTPNPCGLSFRYDDCDEQEGNYLPSTRQANARTDLNVDAGDDAHYAFTFDNTFGRYYGTLPGDSGGPMFFEPPLRPVLVCGVSSQITDAFFYITTRWTRVSAPENEAFIRDIAVRDGNWYGECSGPDGDGDGVPDACDNCRLTKNPDQKDTDSDGRGDVCDNCPTRYNPGWTNSNLLEEREAFFIKHGRLSTVIEENQTTEFPGDACDATPLTLTARSARAFSDPRTSGDRRVVTCTVAPGPGCGGVAWVGECDLPRENVITAASFSGGADGVLNGTTRFLSCACPAGKDANECRTFYNCGRDKVAATSGTAWARMSLSDVDKAGASANLGLTSIVRTSHPTVRPCRMEDISGTCSSFPGFTSSPDVRSFGWRYWEDLDPSLLPVPTTATTPIFDGLVWTWVKAFEVAPAQPANAAAITGDETAQLLRQGVSRIAVYEEAATIGKPCVDTTKAFDMSGFRPPGCEDCGWTDYTSFIGYKSDDPSDGPLFAFSPLGGVRNVTRFFSHPAVEALHSSAYEFVAAPEDMASTLGVFLDAGTKAPTLVLGAGAQAGLTAFDSGNQLPDLPPQNKLSSAAKAASPPSARHVRAFSSTRQEFVALEPGVTGYAVRAWRIGSAESVVKTFVSTLRPLDPLTMIYDPGTDSYLVLDRVPLKDKTKDKAHTIRLLRLPRGQTAELVTEWTATGRNESYSLSTNRMGWVAVTAKPNKKDQPSRVVVLDAASGGGVIAHYVIHGSVVAPASVRVDGVSAVFRKSSSAAIETVRFELPASPAGGKVDPLEAEP